MEHIIPTKHKMTGRATYYSDSLNGRPTHSGQIFSNVKLTAAHKTLPHGTVVRVTNLSNGKQVIVTINDRGPHGNSSLIIDVTREAAKRLGFVAAGTARVKLEIINKQQ